MSRNDPPGFIRFHGMAQKPTNTMKCHHERLAYAQRLEINETILQIAEAEYERQYGTNQTIDRLRERNGLSIGEVVMLLASAVTRFAPPDELRPKSLSDPPRKMPLGR